MFLKLLSRPYSTLHVWCFLTNYSKAFQINSITWKFQNKVQNFLYSTSPQTMHFTLTLCVGEDLNLEQNLPWVSIFT